MTDGEVAPAQWSGLVKPAPPLPPRNPLELRAHRGLWLWLRSGGQGGLAEHACVRV